MVNKGLAKYVGKRDKERRASSHGASPLPKPRRETYDEESKPSVRTFNWEGAGKSHFFVANKLREGEMSEIAKPALRRLINLTALGEGTPQDIESQIVNDPEISGKEVSDAIKEGIHRWHTNKER